MLVDDRGRILLAALTATVIVELVFELWPWSFEMSLRFDLLAVLLVLLMLGFLVFLGGTAGGFAPFIYTLF